ncbi:hypothetical protein BLA29_001730, partial [Euroglyphus maynei]
MGLSSAARGHMRPFGGRSPPFLVATLCVGLCVLGISYWRLGIQYNDLEDQLRRLIQKKDSLEANESFISKQLELREENFSEAKVNLQKKEKELLDMKNRFDEQTEKLKTMQKTNENLERSVDDQRTKLEAKEAIIRELREKNRKLESDYTEVKSRLDSSPKSPVKNGDESNSKAQQQSQTNSERSQPINVIHSPPLNNDGNKNELSSKSSSLSAMDSKKNIPAPGIAESQAVAAIPEMEKPQQQQSHNSNEQIQKPKIDPIIKL